MKAYPDRKSLLYLPMHLYILPVFFILHKHVQYAGLLQTRDEMISFLLVMSGTGLLYGTALLLLRERLKAAVFSTLAGVFYLFFADIKYTLQQIPFIQFLSAYKILLPICFIAFLLLFLHLRRRKTPPVVQNRFLNILLVVYILIDCSVLFFFPNNQSRLKLAEEKSLLANRAAPRPGGNDIYYIIADGYPALSFQEEVLALKDPHLDSFLRNSGFRVLQHSRSNYSNTAFSMASVFGMNYLSGIDTAYQMAPYHYNRCIEMVSRSPLVRFLEKAGYLIRNESIFDLPNHPSAAKDRFLSATSLDIIFYSSLHAAVQRDLFWQLIPGYLEKAKLKIRESRKQVLGPTREYNRKVSENLYRFLQNRNGGQPAFCYLHLKMPHFPYFFDSIGRAIPENEVFAEPMISNPVKFSAYIQYTNRELVKLIRSILEKTEGKAVIILQSDHGTDDFGNHSKKDAFRNLSAFYFPDRDYSLLYDSMSNVNTFRVLLNKYFNTGLNLLPDQTYYLK